MHSRRTPPRLVRMTTVPMSLQFLLTGQLVAMHQAGMDVVAISSPGAFLTALEQEGIRVYGVPMLRHVSPWRDLCAVRALTRIFRAERPHIVHTHTPKAGLVGMLAAYITRVPIRIHTYAGAPYDGTRGLAVTLVKLADAVTGWLATHVWSVGKDLAAFLETEGVVRRGRLEVLGAGSSNGVDRDVFYPSQRDQPCTPPRYIWIGRVATDKGLEELAALWTQIAAHVPQATLEIVGELDERDPAQQAVVTRLRQEPRVHFAGFRLDVAERLRAADLLLFTSRREGLPGVVLQAQACGIPVVALHCRGVGDALIDGEGGRIFARAALPEAAHAAVAITQNLALWRHHHVAGPQFVAEHFDRQAFHAQLAQCYQALLDARLT